MGVRWGAAGGRLGAAWGAWGACRGVVWGCGLLPSLSLRGRGEKDAGELRPESLGIGAGALAAGYPWLGWPGCPGVPWGRRLPTSAGCETTTCVSVTEVLRVLPQELTRRGDCGPGRPRWMTMKRKWGARMSLAVGTFPRPGGGRCPGLFPSSRGRGAVVGGGVATSQRVSVPVGGGYEAPGRLAPPAQQPARRRLAFSASCRGGGRSGQCGAPPLSWQPALPVYCIKGQRGLVPHAGAAPPQPGWGTGGGSGGRGRRMEGGGGSYRAPAGPTTLQSGGAAAGVLRAPPRGLRPPPCGCGEGEAKATRGHDTWCIGREV